MKIYVEYDVTNQSGKGQFLNRLTKQWDKTGVKWSSEQAGCSARLAVTRHRTESKLPTAIRIDGSHNEITIPNGADKKRLIKSMEWKNAHTAKNINTDAATIWQSEFCKRMGHAIWGVKPKSEYVIFNGADPADYLPRTPKKEVVLSAHWKRRPHKRLKEMYDIAVAYTAQHPDVVFHVYGNVLDAFPAHENILFHGRVGPDKLKEAFSTAGCMLNICYADWCPNAVVEALVAGVPVICTANQGVSEIVKDSGIIVDIDEPIPQKHFVRAMNKPIRDIKPVYEALDKILYGGATFPPAEHLYIETVAKQYEGVFHDILS